MEDPELQELAGKLPQTVMHSRADSTVRKYLAAYKRWKQWALKYGLPVMPAKEHHVGLYLQHLADTVASKSAVEEACNSLAWVHCTAGISSPTSSPFVRAILDSLRRLLAKPVSKKAPMKVDILQKMVKDAELSGTLSDLRLVTACLLSFAGFLRFDELVKLRPCEISVQDEYMTLRLPHSKTDQLRKGNEVIIARSRADTCLVGKLEQYMTRTQMGWEDQRFLFRPICKVKSGDKLHESGSISYTCLNELFKKKLAELGYNPSDFGLHSMRVGRATQAANAGVPDRLVKRHGRWKSENAKDGYIEDSLEQRLTVTKQLGL